MQIIRRGNFHKGRTFSAQCPACTCLFRFAREEAQATVVTRQSCQLEVKCPDPECATLFIYTLKLHESQGVL